MLDDPRTEGAGRLAVDAMPEPNLDPVRRSEVEVLAEHLLEEVPAMKRPVQVLGEAVLALPDVPFVTVVLEVHDLPIGEQKTKVPEVTYARAK
jgi:hypothetical protein